MSPNARQKLSVVVGLLLLAMLAFGAIIAVRAFVRVLASLDSDIAVAIIAAAATLFVSALSLILGKAYELRALVHKEHREKKIPVYEDLIKFIFRILSSKTGNAQGIGDSILNRTYSLLSRDVKESTEINMDRANFHTNDRE